MDVKPPQQDEAVHHMAAAVRQLRDAWAQAAEQMIPVMRRFVRELQPLLELVNSPQGKALITLHEAGLLPPRTEHCHCLCGVNHPGVHPCWGPVPVRRLQQVPVHSATMGVIQVSMCPACADLGPRSAPAKDMSRDRR